MKKTLHTILTIIAVLVSFNSYAAAGVAAGETKSGMCAGWHGTLDIAFIPTYPNLAGQNEKYLITALKAYKNKSQSGGQALIMQGQAANLSDDDIKNLSA